MAASSFFQLPYLQIQNHLHKKSTFLGQTHFLNFPTRSTLKQLNSTSLNPIAKFNLYEILGGRGLCNGEKGLQQVLNKPVSDVETSQSEATGNNNNQEKTVSGYFPDDGFDKEMMGFTGGFPGGEMGLKRFIEQNPVLDKLE